MIYLTVGFVLIFTVIIGNINMQKLNDPYYSCQRTTNELLSDTYDPQKGLSIKVDKGDLTETRNLLEEHGLEVAKVSMHANSIFMNLEVKAETEQDVSRNLCVLKDSLALSDVTALK